MACNYLNDGVFTSQQISVSFIHTTILISRPYVREKILYNLGATDALFKVQITTIKN
jgi:hypothetical protein